VSPEQRRTVIDEVRRSLEPAKVSERRACKVLGQSRSTQRYQRRQSSDEAQLLAEMRRLSRRHPRWGSRRIYDALRKRGWTINHKRVERLWQQEGMQVPEKQQKQRRVTLGGSENSCVRQRAERPNHVWSYDFIEERTEQNRKLRMLVVTSPSRREDRFAQT